MRIPFDSNRIHDISIELAKDRVNEALNRESHIGDTLELYDGDYEIIVEIIAISPYTVKAKIKAWEV